MAERNGRRRFGQRLLSILLALGVLLTGAMSPPPVQAQERPRSIMDMLFGKRQDARPTGRGYGNPAPRRVIKKPRKRNKATASRNAPSRSGARSGARTAAAAAAAPSAPVEKSETARTVLVVGDFLAGSLSKGLEDAVSDSREIKVVGKTDGSSGLVRSDHYDWPARIGASIDEVKPAVVVVMLGANDRQAIRDGSVSLALRTPEWGAKYTERVEALASAIKARNLPLVWIGMPPFQSDRASEDMVYLNDLYRTAALKVGGEFVDIWGGFTDANGAFASSGPDTAGQTTRLRNSDGITLTPAGQDKLAYFAEKPVTKILGLDVDDLVASLGARQLSADDLPAVGNAASAVATPPVSFGDPSLDGGDQLLGGAGALTASGEASPRDRLVVKGTPVVAAEGRADQFNWTGRGTAVSPVTRDNAIVFRGSTSLGELRREAAQAQPTADEEAAKAAAAAEALKSGSGDPVAAAPGPAN